MKLNPKQFDPERKNLVAKFASQTISASSNILIQVVSYVSLPAGNRVSVFVWFGVINTILGFGRYFFGDRFLLNYRNNFIQITEILTIGGSICLFLLFSLYLTNWFELAHTKLVLIIIFTAIFALLQDIIRYEFFSREKNILAVQIDIIWFSLEVLSLIIFSLLSSTLSSDYLLLIWALTGSISFIWGYGILIKLQKTDVNSRDVNDRVLQSGGQVINGLLPLLGNLTNVILNAILVWSNKGILLENIRGIQLIAIPIAFISNFQQLYLLKELASRKTTILWKSRARQIAMIITIISTIASTLFFNKALGFSVVPVAIFLNLEAYLNFELSQFGYIFRATHRVRKLLSLRILWALLSVFSVLLLERINKLNLLSFSFALLFCTLISLLSLRKTLSVKRF